MYCRRWWIFSSNKHHIWSHLPRTIIKLFEHFSTETSCFFFVCEGWYKIVYQLMNYYLFGKIFLSSVQKTLVDLLFKQILNIFPITCIYFNIVPESFNRDSLFFTRYFVCVGLYQNSHCLMNYKLCCTDIYVQCAADAGGSFLQINYTSGHNYLELIWPCLRKFQPRLTVLVCGVIWK